MKLNDPRITILINREYTVIELHEHQSNVMFCRIRITPEQLSAALSRHGRVECSIDVDGLDKLGKVHENKSFEFEINDNIQRKDIIYLNDLCLKALKKNNMSEWTPDLYYNSQDSFFKKDEKQYARVTIRRWT